MRRRALSLLRSIVLLALVIAALTGSPQTTTAQDDATRFFDALATRDAGTILADPVAGGLTQSVGFVVTQGAGVMADSFIASATFAFPVPAGTLPWDIGFAFHRTPDAVQQLVIDSDGNWYYSPWPAGTLQSGVVAFDTSLTGMNTLELVVDGSTGLFGFNGEFVASFQLPPPVAADVEIGTAFFTGTTEDGRVIPFFDFQVWSLAAGRETGQEQVAVETGEATPEGPSLSELIESILAPEGTPEAATPPTVTTADASLFSSILVAQEGVAPLAGPFNANLKEIEAYFAAAWADVHLTDFHARAVFEVPGMESEIPWNIGVVFGTTSNGTLRFAADSLGSVWFSVGVATAENVGSAPAIATGPGESNVLDLLVSGGRAMLGINGELVAAVTLPADAGPGDVAIGTALYSDQTVVDRVTRFSEFVVLPLAADALASESSPTPTPSASDSEAFANFLADTAQFPATAGPFAGRLVEGEMGTVALAPAGVNFADFAAAAEFVNPSDPSQGLWDAGFRFRNTGAERHSIVIDSLGDVYATLAGVGSTKIGSANWYDPSPSASNILQLVVVGNRAIFGVNNQFVAAVDLPAAPTAGEVSAGSGFFDEDHVVGRVTGYRDFSVWELS